MKSKSLLFFLMLWVCSLAYPIAGASKEAVASFEDNELLMGNIAKLSVSVPVPTDTSKVVFPALQKALLDKRDYFSVLNDTVEILTVYNQSLDYDNDRFYRRFVLQVQAFDSGHYELPPFVFLVGRDTVRSNPVTLNVLPVKAKADDQIEPFSPVVPPFEVYPQLEELRIQKEDYRVWIWIVSGLAILAAILLIVLYIRFLKTGKFGLSRREPAPETVAIKGLNKLASQQLPQKGKTKEYYTRLTEILRTYLHKKFDVKTFEKTSVEILDQVESSEVLQSFFNVLQSIFNTADYVKFAKVTPTDDEDARCMKEAVDFVNRSKNLVSETEPQLKGKEVGHDA